MPRIRPAAALALLAVAAWLAYMAVFQVDDAYIVYRYAANLARGDGLVFNPGARVEGVSCFLWTVLLSPFAFLKLPLPVVAPILTALAGLAMIVLLPTTSATLAGRTEPDVWDRLAPVLLACHPSFAYWSVGALETVPFALLILLALRDQAGEIARGAGRRSALWMGLAALVRPETPVLAAAFLMGRWFDREERVLRRDLRDVAAWTGVVALFFLPFLSFRRLYFGAWLPNTYYAKSGQGLMSNLQAGLSYSREFLSSLVPGFGVANDLTAFLGMVLLVILLAYGLPRRGLRTASLLVLAIGAAVLFDGGDWMVLHRFWVPALAPLCILIAALGRDIAEVVPRLRPAMAGVILLLALGSVTAAVRERNGPNGLKVNAAGYRYAHHQVAGFLRQRAHPDDTVALMDVGIIGYESGLRVLDISGLTEPEIARAPGGFLEKRYPVESLLARSPRFFVLVNGFRIDEAIMKDPVFLRNYRLVLERNHRYNWTPAQSYTLHVYERRQEGEPGAVAPVTRELSRG